MPGVSARHAKACMRAHVLCASVYLALFACPKAARWASTWTKVVEALHCVDAAWPHASKLAPLSSCQEACIVVAGGLHAIAVADRL